MRHLKELYRVEQFPVFQNRMYHTETDAKNCTKGNILLVQDLDTGLIFNHAFKPELMKYDADYQNEQAVSSVFRAHLAEVARLIKTYFKDNTLIEVGCGKGYFLEYLQDIGFKITGLDPTYEGENPHIIKEYFTSSSGLKADGIILRHVLEHIQNPVEFLIGLREANSGQGKIYIEVPCFDWICKQRAWFDIFYEHVNYFRISDFERIFSKIYASGHIFGGQYFYIIADMASIRYPTKESSDNFEFPNDFLETLNYYTNLIRQDKTRQDIIWGGASKGVIFSLLMQRAGINIDFIVDINPAKQGKYLAATGLKVSSPEILSSNSPANTNIFIMNSNYLNEIKEMTRNQFNYLTVDHGII